MDIEGWDAMIGLVFNAGIRWNSLQFHHFSKHSNKNTNELTVGVFFNSVRISNELGASNARVAKFVVIVVFVTSVFIGVVCMVVVFATRNYFPYLFTNNEAIAEETTRLSILLGVTTLLNSLQPVLFGKCKQISIIHWTF